MNRKVLVAERAEACDELVRMLEASFEVHPVRAGAEALALCEARGPFAAVVAGDELDDMEGVALLSRMKVGWPDTARLLVAGHATFEAAIQALHEGAIFRFVRRPLEEGLLRDALESGVERYRQVAAERLFTEQLQFSRESLLTLTETLERRLADQVLRVQGMQDFTFQLGRTRSLGEVARLAAESASRLLGGRGVVVCLAEEGESPTESRAGPELSGEVHTQEVMTTEGRMGRIDLDARSPEGRELREQDRDFLASLAVTTGIAARNLIHRRERDDAQHATILALARLAEYRDDETGRHLERVAEYCRLIAFALRENEKYAGAITASFVDDLVLSAPLHDIGKVGVPDSILFKPGKLTEEEWEIMRRHTTIGAETILGALENTGERGFLRMGHDVAWCHHERWDGKGYPRRLGGAAIPLAARIMAVADCYDALTTSRPYKAPWTHQASVDYVRENAGTQFDPSVAEAFLSIEDQANRVRCILADEETAGAAA